MGPSRYSRNSQPRPFRGGNSQLHFPYATKGRGVARSAQRLRGWSASAGGGSLTSRRWRFYKTRNDKDVVREDLKSLGVGARAAILEAMKRVVRQEHMPYEQESVGNGIFAVRVFFADCTYRLLYSPVGSRDQVLLALHVINKKDRKLPKVAKDLAIERLKDWTARD
ncbi:type II toxin-antitoxin system RelE/ParE family toxin [Streptomyces sp. NPDC096012]|uniref:type II toxin-antitoxin system RelE/ParE family toxin n=1 Tax=Streptomyces sp. NPDC096012 TaxID=3155684 RepID=UPI003369C2F2